MNYIPTFPYNGEQVLINSDRVLINSRNDSIFLFSNKIINFSSNDGIHFNTDKNVVLNSSNIQLGLNAKEPLVRGNKCKNILEQILNNLENTGKQLSKATDSNGNPIPAVQTAGSSLDRSSKRIKTLLKELNSEQNYTL